MRESTSADQEPQRLVQLERQARYLGRHEQQKITDREYPDRSHFALTWRFRGIPSCNVFRGPVRVVFLIKTDLDYNLLATNLRPVLLLSHLPLEP